MRSVRSVWCSGKMALVAMVAGQASSSRFSYSNVGPPRTGAGLFLFACTLTVCSAAFQAVEELLESLELEKSNYHMGLSRVSTDARTTCFVLLFWRLKKTFRMQLLTSRGKTASISGAKAKFREVQYLAKWISVKSVEHHAMQCHIGPSF